MDEFDFDDDTAPLPATTPRRITGGFGFAQRNPLNDFHNPSHAEFGWRKQKPYTVFDFFFYPLIQCSLQVI